MSLAALSPGLDDVIAADTVLSHVDGAAGRLIIRGYDLEELAKGDVIFAATGVTDGSLLEGVKYRRGGTITTESIVMRASSRTVRRVKSEHRTKP